MPQPRPVQNDGSSNSQVRERRTLAHFGAFSGLIIAFGIAASSPVYAKPISTSFQDAIAASETIAIVRLVELPPWADRNAPLRPKATLDVLQVLKGNLQLGKQQVGFEAYPRGAPGEFIAFLDKNRVWQFTARPSPGKKVESDVLGMEGFYDTNMHFVLPGLITLKQLKTYLKDETLLYSIEGPIWFPQRLNPAWKASGIQIKLTYDAVKKQARLTGLPKLAGFPAEPTVRVGYDRRTKWVYLDYSRLANRPLQLVGQVDALDSKSGSLLAKFMVNAPDALGEKTLRTYLADARLGHCYYKYRLHCAASEKYPKLKDLVLTLENDAGGETLEGWDNSSPEFDWMESKSEDVRREGPISAAQDGSGEPETAFTHDVARTNLRTKTNQDLRLWFDLGKRPKERDLFAWDFQNHFLYAVYGTPVRGSLYLRDGKAWHQVTTFTVDLDPVAFGSPR